MKHGCKEAAQKNTCFIFRKNLSLSKWINVKELKSDHMFLPYFITVQKDANTGAYFLYTAYELPYKVIHMPYTSIN